MLPRFLTESSDKTPILNTLMTNGKSKTIEDFNVYEEYLDRFKEKPSTLKIIDDNDFFDVKKIRSELSETFPKLELLFRDEYYSIKDKVHISKRDIWLIDDGYILVLSIDGADTFFNEPKDDIGVDDNHEISDYNNLIIPNINSKNYSDEVFQKVVKVFENAIMIEKKRTTIGMAAIDNGEMYVKDFNLGKNFTIKEMDLHYGDGFVEFNKKLIKKLKKDKKGLVLFHGDPGTGKTFYIRHLLSKISETDNVLYFPPTMVNTITDPGFVNFINTWVNDNEKSCILLIEDAEPLLISRDVDERNIGITNLLNLTDGLLNDIFGIKIICTFNTSLSNLDKALLRPERLIARKEFVPLTKENGLLLAEKIKIDKDKIIDGMTLADIYSIKKNSEVLLHDVGTKRKTIGF